MTFAEHPQTTGQVEATNKFILKALRTRFYKSKGLLKEELPNILWAYHCSPQTTTNVTPLHLTYNTYATIPIEVREPLTIRFFFQAQQNEENIRVELEIKDEV